MFGIDLGPQVFPEIRSEPKLYQIPNSGVYHSKHQMNFNWKSNSMIKILGRKDSLSETKKNGFFYFVVSFESMRVYILLFLTFIVTFDQIPKKIQI